VAQIFGLVMNIYLNGRRLNGVTAIQDMHRVDSASEVTITFYPSSVVVDTPNRRIDINCLSEEESSAKDQ
jgi:hypothetical protein